MILVVAGACVAMCAGPGAVSQDEVRLVAPLRYESFKDLREMILFTGSGTSGYVSQSRDVTGYTLPKIAGVRASRFRLENTARPVVAVLIPGKQAATPPKALTRYTPPTRLSELWLDLDGDKKFSADEKFKAQVHDSNAVFGPVSLPATKDGALPPVYFLNRYGTSLSVLPGGYYLADIERDGKAFRIGLVDANANGIVGERIGGMSYYGASGDIMVGDFNGNGKFDVVGDATEMGDTEVRPVSWMMQMPDRGFYRMRVSEDANSVTLFANPDAMGTVTAKCQSLAMVLEGPDGMIFTYPQQPPVALPAGAYSPLQMVVCAADASGKNWTLTVSGSETRSRIRVRAGQATDLGIGGNLKATLDVSPDGDGGYSLGLPITDGFGNSVAGIAKPDGKQPAEPKVKVVDATGKALFNGTLTYG